MTTEEKSHSKGIHKNEKKEKSLPILIDKTATGDHGNESSI